MRRAVEAAKTEFPSMRPDSDRKGKDKDKATDKVTGGSVEWNGNFTRDAPRPCISFNLGTKHPAKSLDAKGTCRHNHVCDHWVSNKGPKGTCGGNHPRNKCDNPQKCDTPV